MAAIGESIGALLGTVHTGDSVDIRPPVGETWLITWVFGGSGAQDWAGNAPYECPPFDVRMTDGSTDYTVYKGGTIGTDSAGENNYFRRSLVITRAMYLKVVNNNGADAVIGYTGIRLA